MAITPLSKPYISGQGYHTYRTPAIVKANNGDLLAFCGARNQHGDDGPCDIVLRRSTDRGKTWKSRQVIAGSSSSDRYAIPVPVVLDNGTIILLYLRSPGNGDRSWRKVYKRTSVDNGKNWSSQTEITSQVTRSSWDPWIGIGPTHGIVKQQTPNKGRIIIGGRYSPIGGNSRSYVIYSDNNGSSWNIGGELSIRSSEVAVVELTNGNIMLNARAVQDADKHRIVGVSTNGGQTISSTWHETQLPCPQRCGSLLRYGDSILFSNPRDVIETKGTVQRSANNGSTWPWRERYNPNGEFSSYSDMVRVNGDIGVLVEWGPSSSQKHKEIRFIIVPKGELGL